MKTLIQYLFEATVNTAELEKNLKFEETNLDDILDILDTDEYNHFVELCGERYTKKQVKDGVFLLRYSTHFKIMYKDTLLGVFSVCLPKNFNDLINDRGPDRSQDMWQLKRLFYPFLKAAIAGEPYDIIDKNIYNGLIKDVDLEKIKKCEEKKKYYADMRQTYDKNFDELTRKYVELAEEYKKHYDSDIKRQLDEINDKTIAAEQNKVKMQKLIQVNDDAIRGMISEQTKELVKRIMDVTGFVVIWQLSKDAKKKIDVNQIALLKIFFQKLTELIKNTGAKYIMAQGKDEHVTKAYIKLGGFHSTEELFKKYTGDYDEEDCDFLNGTVIKRI